MDNLKNTQETDQNVGQNEVSKTELEEAKETAAQTEESDEEVKPELINETTEKEGETVTQIEESDEEVKPEPLDETTEETIEDSKEQIEEETIEGKPKNKNLKWIMIVGGIIIAAIIAFLVVPSLMTPDLSNFDLKKEAELNSMKFKIPEGCKEVDSTPDSYCLYSLNKGKKTIGLIEIQYRGDSDLEGDAGYDSESAEHKTSAKAIELIPGAKGSYRTVEADNSVYEITVYANDKEVKGREELQTAIADTFDTSGYSNPREEDGITYRYDGDASAGVVIDNDTDKLLVWESYITSIGEGEKSASFTVDKPVKLEAGKKSEVNITLDDGDSYTLKIKCSDEKPRPSFDAIAKKVEKKVMNSKYPSSGMFSRFEVNHSWADEYEKGDFSIRTEMKSDAYEYLIGQGAGSDAALTYEAILLDMSNYCSELKKAFTKEGYDTTVNFHVWAPGTWVGQTAFSYVTDEGIKLNPFA